MAHCAAKAKDGSECPNEALEGQKYCAQHLASYPKPGVRGLLGRHLPDILAAIGVIVAIIGITINHHDVIDRNRAALLTQSPLPSISSPSPTLTPPPMPLISSQPPTPTCAPATSKAEPHSMRFTTKTFPPEWGPVNVYYSVDCGPAQLLGTIGSEIDKAFDPIFSTSIRVWVEVPAGKTLQEDLYLMNNDVASGDVGSQGLTYTEH